MSADSFNYHHLLYFWTVAQEGSIAAACEKLKLAQPTISGQLKKLEQQLGGKLYEHIGRELVLTDLGETVFRYTDRMFSIGQELAETLQGRPQDRPVQLHVGIPEILPKLIVFRLLKPVLDLPEPVQVFCHEGEQNQLLARLATHELDVVFSDSPSGSFVRVKVFNHFLGESLIGLYGSAMLIQRYPNGGEDSSNPPPILMPARGTAMRRSIERWLLESSRHFRIVGEFDDTALMKVFAEANAGFVAAPLVVEAEVMQKFDLQRLCVLTGSREQFYATTAERKVRHPAMRVVLDVARSELFRESAQAELSNTELPGSTS